MIKDLVNLSILSGIFLVLFAVSEILYRVLKCKAEYTRKLTHIGTGIITLLFPVMLWSCWSVALICGSFMLILLASWKWDILPSINNIDRFSIGSLLYPITVALLFYFYTAQDYQLIYFYLPILILALADPAAALVGKNFPLGKYKVGRANKTLSGSLSFAITAFLVSFYFLNQYPIPHNLSLVALAAIIAISTAVIEAISSDGLDNFTVPIAAYLLLVLI